MIAEDILSPAEKNFLLEYLRFISHGKFRNKFTNIIDYRRLSDAERILAESIYRKINDSDKMF